MKNILSLITGVFVILVVGFGFVKWQTNQNDSDRVREAMTSSIQKSSVKSEDMSQRTNNSDVKTLRVQSLQLFINNYFELYNNGVYKGNTQTPQNTSFNFYLANAKDLNVSKNVDINVAHGVSVIVSENKIRTITYSLNSGKSVTVKDGAAEHILTLKQAVDLKMVKVHAIVKNETFDATAALSVKRSPVASPVSNKLDDLTVPYETRADEKVFLKDLDIRDGVGNKISTSKVKFHLENLDKKTISSKTKLTDKEYKAVYEAIDENSGAKLKVGRKIFVDQNEPLIESPETVTAYVGDSAFKQARAFEMPNGKSGERGVEITDKLKQDLSKDQLGKSGTYTQHLKVTDSHGKTSELTRTLVVLSNTPEIHVTDSLVGIYRVGRMPATSELMAGVTAKAPKDGDLTNLIEIDTSKVDSKTAGKYTITYRVTAPTGGVTTTATRTIEFK